MTIGDPEKLLERLLREGGENTWLEFKVNNADQSMIAEYVSALANSAMLADRDRAFIVFGVQDKTLRKVGTTVNLDTMKVGNEGFRNWLSRVIRPQLMIEFCTFKSGSKNFAIIAVEPTYERPVSAEGVEWIRIGEHKKKLSEHSAEERALWLATGRRKFEDAVALSSVSVTQIYDLLDVDVYYNLRGEQRPANILEVTRKFEKDGLIKDNFEGGFDILNLGAIILAKDLRNFPSVRGKALKVIKYTGRDKRRSDFEEQVNQGYAVAFSPCLEKIKKILPSEERYEAGVRRLASLVPEVVMREVIANALIHQDFTVSGVGPVVEIYENRVEISNPGNSLIEPDRMLDERRSRNEKLASVMRDLGLCEERGGGLDKAVMSLERSYLPAPDFISSVSGMRVVIFGNRSFGQLSKKEKMRSCFFHCVLRWISHDYMSNSSLRERFQLEQEDYQAVSTVISESVKTKRIVPADPNQGRRNAKYVPYWVR